MTDLTDWIDERLDADEKLTDEAKLLIMAALEGAEALADLAGFAKTTDAGADADAPDPAGAFIKQITVQGFRGIGPKAQLDLSPGPGLTIIAGRNGSGKSSFAEALEVALTGTTYRWRDKRSVQWSETWRNLHDAATTRVEVTLAEEQIGPTKITVDWPLGATVDDHVTSLQRSGEKKQATISALGWDGPVETFRPMLSYDELGALFAEGPSKLYDTLSKVLGLEQVTDGVKRLDARAKELSAPGLALAQQRKALVDVLAQLDDDRADKTLSLVNAKVLDAKAVRALAAGTGTQESAVSARLRSLATITRPDPEAALAAAERLRHAVIGMAEAGTTAAASLDRRSAVLRAALEVHEHEGDQDCPVCGSGHLDAAWATSTAATLEELGHELTSLKSARAELETARRELRTLIPSVPPVSSDPIHSSLDELLVEAAAAWSTFASPPSDDLGLADHVVSTVGTLDVLDRVRDQAATVLAARDEHWTAAAGRVAAYADAAEEWDGLKTDADSAKAALKWLKDNEVTLKNERLQPIAKQAAQIWSALRQESNVEMAGLTLAGTATRRRVEIATAVDGAEAPAFSVMSQGELHALALALFLPRATMDESPFRFVVLDDPVQAMDPAKVDGLVEVLGSIAEDRQVVVFSHDDRLAQAVRRAAVPAKIVEVTRETGSKVAVSVTFDPAQRYLRDAFALVKDDGLPDETRRRVLPGLLRLAVEVKSRERFYGTELSKGQTHAEVEAAWNSAAKTSDRVSLAVHGERKDLGPWLSKAGYRKFALGVCGPAMHAGLDGDPLEACRAIEKLLVDVGSGAK